MTKALACQEQTKHKSVTINGVLIESRSSDGYVNATALCKAGQKKLGHYLANKETKDLIDKIILKVGIPTSKLVLAGRGKYGKTWVHPDIAIDLAQWISVDFKYSVIQLVKNEIKEHLQSSPAVPSQQWLKTRSDGTQVRKTLTETAVAFNKTGGQIASMTNQIYKGVFDLDRKSVSVALGIGEKKNLRDNLTTQSLHCISFGEEVATNTLIQTNAETGYASSSESGKRGREASHKMRSVYEEFMGKTILETEINNKRLLKASS